MPLLKEVKKYQKLMKNKLRLIYPEVKTEWSSMAGEQDIYSPKIDIAVGPFAINRRYINDYDSQMEDSRIFIEGLLEKHKSNIKEFNGEELKLNFDNLKLKNRNARCLLAIEIENNVARKHLIGSSINASALGRIGVMIAWTPEKLRALLKLRNYLGFLEKVGKNTFDTTNLLILNKGQFKKNALDYLKSIRVNVV